MNIKNTKVTDILFFLALSIFYCIYFIQNSFLNTFISSKVLNLLIFFVCFLLILQILLFFYNRKISILPYILFCLCGFVVALLSRYIDLIYIPLFMIASSAISFNKIIKKSFYFTVIGVFIVVSCCLFNILPDYVYYHNSGNELIEAHSLGFTYYSTLGYLTTVITFYLIYILDDYFNLLYCVLLFLFNCFSYQIHTVRLAFLISVFLLFFSFIFKNINFIKNFVLKYIIIGIPFICFIFTVIIGYLYNLIHLTIPDFWGLNFYTLNGRIMYSGFALKKYPISLWGNHIIQIGGYSQTQLKSYDYFYIDSGYMYLFLAYGIIFTFIIIGLYSYLLYRCIKYNMSVIFIWTLLILFASIFNNFLITFIFNPIVFLLLKFHMCSKFSVNVSDSSTQTIPAC